MRRNAKIAELREIVQKIALISHVNGTSYEGKIARDSTDSIAGRRPPGGDAEPKPRRPKTPLSAANASSRKEWDEYEDDLAAWQLCYQRRTPDYFARRLERAYSDAAVQRLVDEARETLEAWKRTPIPPGQPPERGAPTWKRWVAESEMDAGKLADMFSVTRQYIYMIRRGYRRAA